MTSNGGKKLGRHAEENATSMQKGPGTAGLQFLNPIAVLWTVQCEHIHFDLSNRSRIKQQLFVSLEPERLNVPLCSSATVDYNCICLLFDAMQVIQVRF